MKTTTLLSIFLLVGLASASPYPSNEQNSGRIVGGIEAAPHEFQFLVDIRIGDESENYHFCGGSIISPDWVVTSALCAQSGGYTATAGDHNVNLVEGTEQLRQVVDVKIHPGYGVPGSVEHENDIALMKVFPPFEFNEFVQPVRLPDHNFTPTEIGTVAGWGVFSQHDDEESPILRKVELPYVDNAVCNVAYNNGITPSMTCYGETGKGFCLGDRGGPLLCGDNQTLCGIVSFSQGCGEPDLPGVFTKTSEFIGWITSSTIPTEEDPAPVETVTTCGGLIQASSARIDFQLRESELKNCVWIIKSPYDGLRFQLRQSSLNINDFIYVTNFHNGVPGSNQRLMGVGQNLTVTAGTAAITLTSSSFAEGEFSLEVYSSGLLDQFQGFSGFFSQTYSAGSVIHPSGGGFYDNNEIVVFAIVPSIPSEKTLRFTGMDIESSSGCRYDAVTVYNWFDSQYNEVARVCGTTLPPTTTLAFGIGLVTFKTDVTETGTGFQFE